jgi:transposase
MRYELTDYEWAAIKPFLPNKPRGVTCVNDRRVCSTAFSGSCVRVRRGSIYRRTLAHTLPATIVSFAGAGLVCGSARRADVSQHGAWPNIPPKRNRTEPICFSRHLYCAGNLVERFFNKIKQCRRVATRYDKLAANYLAFIQLASIRLWLRVNESAT